MLYVVFTYLLVVLIGTTANKIGPKPDSYIPVNPCLSSPCQHGGTCIPDGLDFTCTCTGCFAGELCQFAIPVANPCGDPSACQNGGVCDFTDCKMSCICPPGFTGDFCENAPLHPCDYGDHLCHNGGTCVPGIGLDYSCQCTGCYGGDNCEFAKPVFNPCFDVDNNPCQNGGVCDFTDCTFSCKCLPGYAGNLCETAPLHPCDYGEHLCHNGGTCIPGIGLDYSCQCTGCYGGDNCEYAKPVYNPCLNVFNLNMCLNGGVCDFEDCIFSCKCPPGYMGYFCEIVQCPEPKPCLTAKCAHGFAKDKNGCQTCNCLPAPVICPPDVAIVACFVDPCKFATCPANPDALCISNYCGGCNAVFYDTNGVEVKCFICQDIKCDYVCPFGSQVDKHGCPSCQCLPNPEPCPKGVDRVDCLVNPCRKAECPANPDAVCVPNYCGGCHADFYNADGQQVDCIVCPQIKCANPCPFGTEVTSDGCPTCRCLPNPAPCPGGQLPSACKRNPCDGTICEVNPMTSCVPNYCGGCFFDFYDRNLNIDLECLETNCRGDLVFNQCASACPQTCQNPDIVCKALCKPGCACPEGKVLRKLYSTTCVYPRQCPHKGGQQNYLGGSY